MGKVLVCGVSGNGCADGCGHPGCGGVFGVMGWGWCRIGKVLVCGVSESGCADGCEHPGGGVSGSGVGGFE